MIAKFYRRSVICLVLCLQWLESGSAAQLNPRLVGSCDVGVGASAIAVDGPRAYVSADGEPLRGRLNIVDISNPTTPTVLGYFDAPRTVYGVTISGNYAYLAVEASGVLVLDVSSAADPKLIGAFNTSGSAYSVCLNGSRAYVADGEGGLVILDSSDPVNLKKVGGLKLPGEVHDVVVNGKYAYLADRFLDRNKFGGPGALRIIDISDPTTPSVLSTYKTQNNFQAWDVEIAGHFAYLPTESGLEIVDILDPSDPKRINTGPAGVQITVSGSNAFLLTLALPSSPNVQKPGLQVLDLTDPANPRTALEYACLGYPRSMAFGGRFLYLAANYFDSQPRPYGLQVIELYTDSTALPPLSIERVESTVIVSWSADTNGFLEAASAFSSDWQSLPTPEIVNGKKTFTTSATDRMTFFRLRQP